MPDTLLTDTTATATNDGLTADPGASDGTATFYDAKTQAPTEPAPATDDGTAPVESQATDDAEKPADEDKPAGPPETYEFQAPEGDSYNPDVIAAYSEVAREIGLSQEAAQKVLDKVSPALKEAQQAQLTAAFQQWEADARADKEYGGDKFAANLGIANKALTQFGSPELGALLKESGLGNHPEVIRMFYRAGKAISEDTTIITGGAKQAAPDPAKVLFPTMN